MIKAKLEDRRLRADPEETAASVAGSSTAAWISVAGERDIRVGQDRNAPRPLTHF